MSYKLALPSYGYWVPLNWTQPDQNGLLGRWLWIWARLSAWFWREKLAMEGLPLISWLSTQEIVLVRQYFVIVEITMHNFRSSWDHSSKEKLRWFNTNCMEIQLHYVIHAPSQNILVFHKMPYLTLLSGSVDVGPPEIGVAKSTWPVKFVFVLSG